MQLCALCSQPGAAIGCYVSSCKCLFHLPCAAAAHSQCILSAQHFRVYCPAHAHVGRKHLRIDPEDLLNLQHDCDDDDASDHSKDAFLQHDTSEDDGKPTVDPIRDATPPLVLSSLPSTPSQPPSSVPRVRNISFSSDATTVFFCHTFQILIFRDSGFGFQRPRQEYLLIFCAMHSVYIVFTPRTSMTNYRFLCVKCCRFGRLPLFTVRDLHLARLTPL